jgi:HPt (histidine-containing phosphotransfer) domain-containing protein
MESKQYNLEYLKSISGGDQEFINDMIHTFIVDAPKEIRKIKELIENANWLKVGEEAHRFASSLLFLGLDNLKFIATEIEELGLNNKDTHKIILLINQLEIGCHQIIEELKRDFNVIDARF